MGSELVLVPSTDGHKSRRRTSTNESGPMGRRNSIDEIREETRTKIIIKDRTYN